MYICNGIEKLFCKLLFIGKFFRIVIYKNKDIFYFMKRFILICEFELLMKNVFVLFLFKKLYLKLLSVWVC